MASDDPKDGEPAGGRPKDPARTGNSSWVPPPRMRDAGERAKDAKRLERVMSLIGKGQAIRAVVSAWIANIDAKTANEAFGGDVADMLRMIGTGISPQAKDQLRGGHPGSDPEHLEGEVATASAEIARYWTGSLLHAWQLWGGSANRLPLDESLSPTRPTSTLALSAWEKWVIERKKSRVSLFASIAVDSDGLARVMHTLGDDCRRSCGPQSLFELPYGMQISWTEPLPIVVGRSVT